MLKKWDNKTKKRYLIGALLLFSALFFVSLAFVFGFARLGTGGFTTAQKIGLALLAALLPTGSYTGFCLMLIGKGELSTKQCVLPVVFCLPLVLYACVYGTVMLIPTVLCAFNKNKS